MTSCQSGKLRFAAPEFPMICNHVALKATNQDRLHLLAPPFLMNSQSKLYGLWLVFFHVLSPTPALAEEGVSANQGS